MDIKLSQLNNKKAWPLRLVAVLCILLLSLGVVASYPKFYEHSKSWYKEYENRHTSDSLAEEDWLLRMLLAKNYTLGSRDASIPEDIFSGYNDFFFNNYEIGYDLCYIAVNTEDNSVIESGGTHYMLSPDNIDSFTDYGQRLTFSYDKDGKLSMQSFEGFRSVSGSYPVKLLRNSRQELMELLFEYSYFNEDGSSYTGEESWDFSHFSEVVQKNITLKNVDVTYLIPEGRFTPGYDDSYYKGPWALQQSGILLIFLAFFVLIFLLGLFLPMKPFRFPAELSFMGICTAVAFVLDSGFTYILYEILSGEATKAILEQLHFSKASASLIDMFLYGANVALWFCIGAVTFLLSHSLRLFFVLKPKEWFFTATLTGRFLSFIKRLILHIGSWLLGVIRSVNFSDDLDKKLLKLVGIQFIIAGLLSLTWFFGTFGLLVYSVFLFFFLKKYALELKEKYQVLLSAADEMAEGNLNVTIKEDLGIFSSLGTAISRIQKGFKKAVEEETKSQQMKTELISNVSHDLKTPLTAIITYVDLLKNDNLTEEERRSYIDTLDKKSLRLKQLIEDLFEVSKANSNNITLHPVEIDLSSLVKQVALELEDAINASSIDFRYQLPKDKVCLMLDSEKTYRIIENLIINITKYALPHSRAYIELYQGESDVTLTMKNISAAELNFSTDEITDRFVRGDKSRSTEGSGLGLAIVKSFTELQGGRLTITTDGDLFKASVRFPVG